MRGDTKLQKLPFPVFIERETSGLIRPASVPLTSCGFLLEINPRTARRARQMISHRAIAALSISTLAPVLHLHVTRYFETTKPPDNARLNAQLLSCSSGLERNKIIVYRCQSSSIKYAEEGASLGAPPAQKKKASHRV